MPHHNKLKDRLRDTSGAISQNDFKMLKVKNLYFNSFQECCSIIWDSTLEAIIIDPGFYTEQEKQELYGFIDGNGLKPVKILLTHAHFDHVYGVSECAAVYGIPVLMSPEDRVILDNNGTFCDMFGMKTPDGNFPTEDIADGDVITFGNGVRIKVLETPGHTPGGVCYLLDEEKILFSGDTLFAGAIGRTDNRWGDYDALMKGIFEKLMVLDGDITVIPGHGPHTCSFENRIPVHRKAKTYESHVLPQRTSFSPYQPSFRLSENCRLLFCHIHCLSNNRTSGKALLRHLQ